MIDDEEAEHLPGCNLVVTKAAFQAIGGFDPIFHTAGDDVDFCWRLRDAGFRLGFVPGAFVWHWRRPYIGTFLRQQLGYGRAEKALLKKHPQRFSKSGNAKWLGFVYGGGPVRALDNSIIYHGPMGTAGYQSIVNRMLPLRGLDRIFNTPLARLALSMVCFLQPRLRAWVRNYRLLVRTHAPHPITRPADTEFEISPDSGLQRNDFLNILLNDGWIPAGATDSWDAEKYGTRVLIATEYGDFGARNLLVKLWGDPMALPTQLLPSPANSH
jgi:hypothetical protein